MSKYQFHLTNIASNFQQINISNATNQMNLMCTILNIQFYSEASNAIFGEDLNWKKKVCVDWNMNVWRFLRCKKFIDFFFDVQRISGWCKTINWLTIFINQELCKIPFDGTAKETTLLLFKVFIQWTGRISIYIDLNLKKRREKQCLWEWKQIFFGQKFFNQWNNQLTLAKMSPNSAFSSFKWQTISSPSSWGICDANWLHGNPKIRKPTVK